MLELPRALIFDLDGTLVNSLRDIAEALNECLELLGLEPHPLDDYRYMVGEGVPTLCQRAIGAHHGHLVGRLTELARARYRARPLRYTRPYPRVEAMVARLRDRGLRLGVLSNKPHEMTTRIVRTFWPDHQFAAIQGYVEEGFRKPSPHYALRLCDTLGIPPAQTWIVGDTPTDVETARRAGMPSLGVTWGFRTRADLEAAGADRIIDSPDELA